MYAELLTEMRMVEKVLNENPEEVLVKFIVDNDIIVKVKQAVEEGKVLWLGTVKDFLVRHNTLEQFTEIQDLPVFFDPKSTDNSYLWHDTEDLTLEGTGIYIGMYSFDTHGKDFNLDRLAQNLERIVVHECVHMLHAKKGRSFDDKTPYAERSYEISAHNAETGLTRYNKLDYPVAKSKMVRLLNPRNKG